MAGLKLVRVESSAVKDGVSVIFRFRDESSAKADAVRLGYSKDETIEITVNNTLEDARDKIAAVANQLTLKLMGEA